MAVFAPCYHNNILSVTQISEAGHAHACLMLSAVISRPTKHIILYFMSYINC